MRLLPFSAALALWFAVACAAVAQTKPAAINDGPYVMHSAAGAEALWVCGGVLHTRPLSPGAALKPPCGEVGGFSLDGRNHVLGADVLPAPTRWAAVSDIHGQAALFLTLLRAHGIVDSANHWAWGQGVLVVVGDVFDRGDTQTEVLWALYRLSSEARTAGGRVEVLLGNHETMVLSGDLRYLHAKYPLVADMLGRPYPQLYGADTELGRWLRARATVLKLGDTLFLHAGLHPDILSRWPKLDALNAKMRAHVGQVRAERRTDAEADWLYGRDGPVWHRSYFIEPRVSMNDVNRQLAHFGVRRVVIGHTTRHEIISLYGGKVIGIDAGLKDGKRGELLLWDGKRLARGLVDGKRMPLARGRDDGTSALKSEDDH